MTTKVTVDAHAGWPVRVTRITSDGGHTDITVEPNAVQEFFVWDGQDLRVHEVQPNETPTFGDKAVGRSFNPSGNLRVDRLKALYAEIIDICAAGRAQAGTPSEAGRLYSVAITETQTAQMWAVKAATWKD